MFMRVPTGASPAEASRGCPRRHAVSATSGTELSVLDRQWRTLRSFDDGPTVDTYVAGPSALLRVKARVIHERLDPAELCRTADRPTADRLRSKSFAAPYRLLLVMTPEDSASRFRPRDRGPEDQRRQITGSPSVERLGPADAPWRPGLPSACGPPTPPRTSLGEEDTSINPAYTLDDYQGSAPGRDLTHANGTAVD